MESIIIIVLIGVQSMITTYLQTKTTAKVRRQKDRIKKMETLIERQSSSGSGSDPYRSPPLSEGKQ